MVCPCCVVWGFCSELRALCRGDHRVPAVGVTPGEVTPRPGEVTLFHAPLSPFYPCPALPLGPLHALGLDDGVGQWGLDNARGARGVNPELCSALSL